MNRAQKQVAATVAALLLALACASAEEPTDYQRAQAFVLQGSWDEAIGIIRQLVDANPRDLKAMNLMGLALTGKGEIEEGNGAFEKALLLDPTFYPARKNLAINQLHLHRQEESERNFKIVLDSAPKDPVANMYMGELAFARKDYATAITHLRVAGPWLEKDESLQVKAADCEFHLGDTGSAIRRLKSLSVDKLGSEWQFRAGFLLAQREQFADALRFFEALRNRYPYSYDAGFNLAVCYIQTRRFAEASATLSNLRQHGHKTAELDDLLAEAYEDDGKTQQAIDALREATALAPTDERNYLDLAILCADHKAFELGLDVVNVGLHYLPNSNALVVQRGVIYAMSGKFDLAEKDFELAGKSDTEKDAASAGLGLAYIEQGNVIQATKTLRERIRQDPNNAALQYLFAESLIRSGVHVGDHEFAQAQTALQESVRLNPRFVYSRVDLAKIYVQQGKVAEAIQQLRTALEIDPAKVQVYAQLGTALRKQGKTEEAATMFAKVRELNDLNRKHGELAPLVKGEPEQEFSASGAKK